MGILVDGKWQLDDRLPTNEDGSFVRPPSSFRASVTADGSSGYPAEKGRYHLFVAYGCPWAHRTILYRTLKGLEDVIGMSTSDMGREGWTFSSGIDGAKSELLQPENGALPLHRVYAAAKPDFTGRVTVPALWDKQTGTVVSNESSEIIRMLDAEFDGCGARGPRYYTPELASEIDALNTIIYEKLNNGVYRAGFARSQEAYDGAVDDVFATLDELDQRLEGSRFLLGDRVTEADWRLLPTLLRFDVAYHSAFKCNLRRIEDYRNLPAYLRDLYQTPGVAETVRLDDYRRGYHSIPAVNPTGVVPIGPRLDLDRPHGRAERSYRGSALSRPRPAC
jgi:putative glutathione S-transferase